MKLASFMKSILTMAIRRTNASLDFVGMQHDQNVKQGTVPSAKLLREIGIWENKLSRLRGDNIYDMARLYWSGKGQHSLQLELSVDIPHGKTEDEAADLVTDVVSDQILAPWGYFMIRTLMGRLVVNNDVIVGALVNPGTTSTKATYDILGLPVFCEMFKTEWTKHVAGNPTPYLTRVRQAGDGSLSGSIETIPAVSIVKDDRVFYPHQSMTPAECWDAFVASGANVLLLIGPPGTGKSNYILQMMVHRGFDDKINLIDNAAILRNPGIADWMRDRPSGSVVITEDSDDMVGKRTDGNQVMSGILNTTSGIVQRDLKLIVSTNLPSIKDVDEALIRHGRGFDVLEFKLLNAEQAHAVRDMMGKPFIEGFGNRTNISLAEAINADQRGVIKPSGFGFSQ
jgi:hypothetical protein